MRTLSRALLVLAASVGLVATTAHAQTDFPNKPIRIVVTFPPGGSADAVVRMLLPRLNDKLGQQVVVDNRPGAGGNIGLTVVAKAQPGDGYTLGVGAAGALSANVSLYPQMPFDPVKDFKPVTMLAAIPFVIVGNPSVGVKTQRELIAMAKAQPGKLSIAHGGNGTAMHLSSQLFAQMADIKLNEIPYRGSGPAALDVLGGQVPLAVVDLPSALQHIKAGKLVAYAVTSPQPAAACCPTCPPRPRPACRAMTPPAGSAWWRRPTRPTPVIAAPEHRAGGRAQRRGHQGHLACATWGSNPHPSTARGLRSDYIRSGDGQVGRRHQGCQHQAGVDMPA